MSDFKQHCLYKKSIALLNNTHLGLSVLIEEIQWIVRNLVHRYECRQLTKRLNNELLSLGRMYESFVAGDGSITEQTLAGYTEQVQNLRSELAKMQEEHQTAYNNRHAEHEAYLAKTEAEASEAEACSCGVAETVSSTVDAIKEAVEAPQENPVVELLADMAEETAPKAEEKKTVEPEEKTVPSQEKVEKIKKATAKKSAAKTENE